MSTIENNAINMIATEDITTIPTPMSTKNLPPKYVRFMTYVFWLTNQMKNADLLSQEAYDEVVKAQKMFASVEVQFAHFELFDSEYKATEKSMKKEIRQAMKPKKEKKVVEKDPNAPEKKRGRKKKEKVNADNSTEEERYIADIVAIARGMGDSPPCPPISGDSAEVNVDETTDVKVDETTEVKVDETAEDNVELKAPIVETMVREPIRPSTPVLHDQDDNASEVSKSSIDSNADKKAAKEAQKRAAKEAKEAEKLAAKEAKEAEKLAAKEAKEAEKRAAKEAKEAEKLAAKEAKDAEKRAAKAAKNSEKKSSKKVINTQVSDSDADGLEPEQFIENQVEDQHDIHNAEHNAEHNNEHNAEHNNEQHDSDDEEEEEELEVTPTFINGVHYLIDNQDNLYCPNTHLLLHHGGSPPVNPP